jgi:hypothetical protein
MVSLLRSEKHCFFPEILLNQNLSRVHDSNRVKTNLKQLPYNESTNGVCYAARGVLASKVFEME